MKTLWMTLMVSLLSVSAFGQELHLEGNPMTAPFVSNIGHGELDTYLVKNLDYSPFRGLYRELTGSIGASLRNRGEAHITVITPIEFNTALRGHISMDEINEIALSEGLQEAVFTPICVGQGEASIRGRREATFFVVVQSEDLLRIRRAIWSRFVQNGGQPDAFEPGHYYPHITLGFTARDLHEADGVIKDVNSCRFNIAIE